MNGATENKKPLQLDQKFTDQVKASVGPKCEPRLRQLFCGLVQHMHDFVRENDVTMDEFLMGIDVVGSLAFFNDLRLFALEKHSLNASRCHMASW